MGAIISAPIASFRMFADGNAAVKAHTGLDANAVTRVESDFGALSHKKKEHDPMEDIINLPITNIE